jgi:hypothetical protein
MPCHTGRRCPIRYRCSTLPEAFRKRSIILFRALAPAAEGVAAEPAQTPMSEAVGSMDERVRRAGTLYERAVFSGDAGPLAEADRELDAAEADQAVARGRLMHARYLLRRDRS